ncbi:MAG: transposase [Actinomycetota bacterium]|nr:transposase [Actinomycetota bacterium]
MKRAAPLDELVFGIEELLDEPWDKGVGCPKGLTVREAIIIACAYMRQHIIQEVLAEIFDTSQTNVSRIVKKFTLLIGEAAAADRPSAEDAAEAVKGVTALVDGTLWPCWSWSGERELWAGKYRTTGHGSLIITNLTGRIVFVSEPVPGNQHDMAKLKGRECEEILRHAGGVIGDKGFMGTDYITTPVRKPKKRELYMSERDYNNQLSSLRAPVERAVAQLKTWRILFTDYRRPLKTFSSTFRAAIGLYFFKESFE